LLYFIDVGLFNRIAMPGYFK